MADPYGAVYAAFLTEHPEALAGVKMVDGQLCMNTQTLRHFITWGVANGVVAREEQAVEMLERLPALEAQARAAHGKP